MNAEIALRFIAMDEETKRTYTIRIPEQVAKGLDDAARSQGIAPTTLIQSIVIGKFKANTTHEGESTIAAEIAVATRIESLRKLIERFGRRDAERFDQICFEIVKTRSALLHSLDQTLGSSVVDQIIETSEQSAREYTASLAATSGRE